ncbi:acetylcholinesterase [Colletotrichum tamarilloi]|uniref:Acetylcholinesterase n=1 Tax=Colletotrichum tamarilloi TaxID=1209934 RepID=A0ABQ9RRA2_9PEZI|nr:acetylcholinesterase [Colletotrichum tamarilloi]KAK1510631.1 acetylcholinesterase [Colletotrichum tamarilloi]
MSIISESNLGVDYVTVNSTFGSVKGFINRDYPNVAQFLGIPFAEPPIGPRRWLPPTPKAPVDSIDGTKFGLSCPQQLGGRPSVYNTDVTEHQIRDDTSEDCLSLCIWAPKDAAKEGFTKKFPVIVFITGGAFLVGGSTIPYQNPTPWIESSKRHIVVSINYRLNVFGFPNAAGLSPDERNLGFLDQRLGLEWVHQHIASFGGDPSRMTHFGQSAGARSIDCHAFLHPDKPLVRNLILHSGCALPLLPVSDPGCTHFSALAKALGFPGGDAAAELEFMRQQPSQELLEAIQHHWATEEKPFLSFRPVVDGFTLFDDYEDRAKAGNFSKLPAIYGTMNDEGNSVAVYHPDRADSFWAEKITKDYFLGPMTLSAAANDVPGNRARSAHAPTFRFLLKDYAPAGTSSFHNISPRPWLRAYHSSDMPLIFGTHDWARGPSTPLEAKVSRVWQDLYVAFAEDGPDGLRKMGWNDMREDVGIVLGGGEKGWETVSLEEVDNR